VNQPVGLQRAIEAGWLLAAALVPAAIMKDTFMVGWIQMPKVFMLRTLAIYLVVMLVFEWALARRDRDHERTNGGNWSLWRSVMDHPARLVYFGAATVLFANLVSAALSPVPGIAVWGVDLGWDTYGLGNVIPYLVIFATVATHMRTEAQFKRLFWVLAGASAIFGYYAVGQRFGFDFIRAESVPLLRTGATFGNPIFLGSVLTMTIPVTVALFLSYRRSMADFSHIWIGSGLLALPLTGLAFSSARGAWVGLFAGGIVFVVALAWVAGRGWVIRALSIGLVAFAFAGIMTLLPAPGDQDDLAEYSVTQRVANLPSAVGGGLSNRSTIWKTAVDVYFTVPWIDPNLDPSLPELRLRALRPLIGYGPDMFGYAYPLIGEATYTSELASHGHNFIVHTAIELGLLGVLGYLGLVGALLLVLFRMLRAGKEARAPVWFTLMAVGLTAAVVGRVVEQIPGKAQVSDQMLTWMLAGVIVAMAAMRFDSSQLEEEAGSPQRARPNRRRRARRGSREASADGGGSMLTPRVGLAALTAVVAVFFWTQTVYSHVSGAVQSAEIGDLATLQDYERLQASAPDAAINHLRFGNALFKLALRESSATVRIEILNAAVAAVQPVLDRNPMDHRAWSRISEIRRELAFVDRELSEEAIHDNFVQSQLMPGFWQSQLALSWAYVKLERWDEALVELDHAVDLTERSGDPGNASMVPYLRAVTYQNLDRNDEAVAEAARSFDLTPSGKARDLLLGLLETYSLSQAGELLRGLYELNPDSNALETLVQQYEDAAS
jgi:O-antigen ligase/tetratricopeptide (TPR) repeat protein